MFQLAKYIGGRKTSNQQTLASAPARPQLPAIDKSHFVTAGLLGEGGFGKVMTGMLMKNGNWYAIKQIQKSDLLKHKCGLAMLLGEVNAMIRVDHPSVINLHFAFQDRKRCFLVMDLQSGGDLRYYLRKQRCHFEEIDVAFIVACISSALDHIHSKNIIHRDIKPENIILDERGYPYLTDFGVAYVQLEPAPDNTLSCTLASGTKQYLAPEVFTKSHLHGPEVDFWSLGVVAYELLFGRRPFEKHCPVNFITYLEKAFSQKRKQVKEMKMRQLSMASGDTTEIIGSSSVSSSMEISTSLVKQVLSLKSMVPPRPNVMNKNSAASSTAPSSPAMMMRSSCSTNESSSSSPEKGNTRGLFCSSVGYTQASQHQLLSSQSSDSPSKRVPLLGSMGHNSHSFDLSVSSIGSDRHHIDVSLNENSFEYSGVLPSPSTAANGNNKLPDVNKAGSGSGLPAHRSLFRRSYDRNASGSIGGSSRPALHHSASVTDRLGHGHIHQSPPSPHHYSTDEYGATLEEKQHEEELTVDDDSHVKSDGRARPGDHWLVDETKLLHPSLVVPIPDHSPYLGMISPDCQKVLMGLFEVRPSHRLGGRNMTTLRNCKWFAHFHLCDWDGMVASKMYLPRFQPGKRFMKDCLERMDDTAHAQYLGDDTSTTQDSSNENQPRCMEEELTKEEQEQFVSFAYLSAKYAGMFSTPVFPASTMTTTKE